MRNVLLFISAASLGLFTLAGCDDTDALAEETYEFDTPAWAAGDTLTLTFSPDDDARPEAYTLWAFFTLTEDYPYRNIHFRIRHWLNNSTWKQDSLYKQQFFVMDNKGNWFVEDASGDTYDFRGRLIDSLRLRPSVDHRFEIIHYMRKDSLPGVEEFTIGLTDYTPAPVVAPNAAEPEETGKAPSPADSAPIGAPE
jgi:gliding motility-associated lipoprotein GldH